MQIEIQQLLHHTFGHNNFRGSQQDVINTLCNGEHALAVMATGAGKSLCYQIPGMIRDGITIIVSPLIALMKDQVLSLQQLGLRAACLYAEMPWKDIEELESQIQMQDLDFLFLSPERLLHESMQPLLNRIDIALFVIDEAHCIWKWGHQFRPEYQQLSFIVNNFPRVPRLALTATAGAQCKQAILDELEIVKENIFEDDLNRENICIWVQPKHQGKQQLLTFIKTRHFENSQYHCGIVYCQSRSKTEQIAQFLSQQGIPAEYYHAGLENHLREQIQNEFIAGKIPVIVATVAFGMGINKSDIRFVAHMDLPRNLEAYYQEIGRAGRDGLAADAWMLFGLRDFQQLFSWLYQERYPDQKLHYEEQQIYDLMQFCIQGNCRRSSLLRAFNAEYDRECQNCDNCFNQRKPINIKEAAAKALSAVYRTGQQFGVDHLIAVIRGKKNGNVLNAGHQKLSVFGVGADKSVLFWRSVFFHLLQIKAIRFHGNYSELVMLTKLSKPILKYQQDVQISEFHYFNEIDYSSHRIRDENLHSELFIKLKNRRQKIAANLQLNPYQILEDIALISLSNHSGSEKQQLKEIEGFADEKIQKYGDEFLEECRLYKSQQENNLKQLQHELGQEIDQKSLEQYCLNHNMTLMQLAIKISRYLDLNLVSLPEILPFTHPLFEDPEFSKLSKCECLDESGIKVLINSHQIDFCWISCIKVAMANIQ